MGYTLMSHWDSLMCELFSKGFLDECFKELELLQDDTEPNFVSEVINVYCEDRNMTIDKLITLFKQPTMDCQDCQMIDAHINNLIGSSASIGARRVTNSSRQLWQFWKERDITGCNKALIDVRTEFNETRAKLKEMVELKQKILHLFNPKKKSLKQGSATASSQDK